MSDISAEKVKELREKSGAGMMDCKRALTATGGDLNQAIDLLRKEGVVKAAKKSGRATQEGLVSLSISPDRKWAALVEVNCETDFVARTDQFQEFISTVSERIVQEKPKDLEGFLKIKSQNTNLQEALNLLIAKLGENVSVRRFRLLGGGGADESLGTYVHAGSKVGVLVRFQGEKVSDDPARDVAMHVAAMGPRYRDRGEVPSTVLDREREILKSSPDLQGKPANILDKIIEGKLNRFYSEVCLLEQPFIKDPTGKKTVREFLREKFPKAQVAEVIRFQVGHSDEF